MFLFNFLGSRDENSRLKLYCTTSEPTVWLNRFFSFTSGCLDQFFDEFSNKEQD